MNATTWTSGPVDLKISTLPYLQAKFTLYRPELELLWVLLTYAPYLPNTMGYTSSRRSRARKYPYITLFAHIVAGLMLVLRYYARFVATRTWPRPELWDLSLFAVFNLTSFILAAYRSSYQITSVRRTGFQAANLIQTSVFAASWLQGGDPALFRASVKLLNWFASFRAVSQWAVLINPGLQKDIALQSSTTSVVSGAFAMWEAGIPAGIPVLFASLALYMVAERAVAESIHGLADSSPIKRMVLASGFVDFNHLKQIAQHADKGVVVDGVEGKVDL